LKEHLPMVRRIILIYLLAIITTASVQLPWLNQQVEEQGQQALLQLENYIQKTAEGLAPLIQSNDANCSPDVITELRKQVFLFSRIKEIGLFDRRYRIYCASNEGATDIRLYRTTRSRLKASSNGQTLALTKAKISAANALFIYSRGESGLGVNALLPPVAFDDIVAKSLSYQALPFEVLVIGRPISTPQLNESWWPDQQLLYRSDLYPLSLSLYLTGDFQLNYLLDSLWVGLLIGSLGSLLHIYVTHDRLSRNSLSAALQRAIENRELSVYYQPIMDARTGLPKGYEALLRWEHPQQGFIGPDIFIPLAEQLGLIVPVTELVLDEVSEFILRHRKELGRAYISVNVSRLHILHHDLAGMIRRRCYDTQGLEKRLLLELTENTVFSESEMAIVIDQFEKLHNCGVRLAVDDFGTGYSGLDFIRRYSFDVLKIDQAFVKGLGTESAVIPLLQSMISLAQQMGMEIIAEGVEHPYQADQLSQLGVDAMQGYLFAWPMPQDALLEWLEQSESEPDSPIQGLPV